MSSGDGIRRRGAPSQSINADSTGSNVVIEGGTPTEPTTPNLTRLGEGGHASTLTAGAQRAVGEAGTRLGNLANPAQLGDGAAQIHVGDGTTTAHSSVVGFQNGTVTTTHGSQFNLTTARGVAGAQAELGPNFTALTSTLEAQGFRLDPATGTFVPADAVEHQGAASLNKFRAGLAPELNAADQEIVRAMGERGFGNMVNPQTAAATVAKLRAPENAAMFRDAAGAVQTAIANPSPLNISKAADYINQLATNTGANAMEILFFVFRESIQATNDDKKYFLERLQDYNLMAEKLSDYLSQLVQDSQRLSAAAAGAKYPEKVTIGIQVQKFDLSTLDSDGKVASIKGYPQGRTVDRAGLNDTIKDVESMQETVRNKRQMASTAFQNFDQKANQLYNLMASVLKVMNEMRSSTTRNML